MTAIPAVGDRIRLIHMPEDPDPIPAGSLGTVRATLYFARFDQKSGECADPVMCGKWGHICSHDPVICSHVGSYVTGVTL